MDSPATIAKIAPYLQSGFLVLATVALVVYVYLVRSVFSRTKTITDKVLETIKQYRWLPIIVVVFAICGLLAEVVKHIYG